MRNITRALLTSGFNARAAPRPEPRIASYRVGLRIVDDMFLPGRITEGDFGGWLRDAMADRRITQRALAMRTGINHSTISRLLASGHMPSLSTAIAIVKVLGSGPKRLGSPYTSLASHSGLLSAEPARAGTEELQATLAEQRRG